MHNLPTIQMTLIMLYRQKSRRVAFRTEHQVESWFWPHVPFSGLGNPIPSHVPVTGNSNSHSPAHTITQPSQAGMRLGLYSPLWASSLGAHVAQASTKPGLCGHCCRELLAHPVPPISCPFPSSSRQSSTSWGAPCAHSVQLGHLFCVGSHWPVKGLHAAAGFADVNKAAFMWVFWPFKDPTKLSPPASISTLLPVQGDKDNGLGFS